MIRKLTIYKTGQRFVSEGSASMRPHHGEIAKEIDLSNLSEEAFKKVFQNPNSYIDNKEVK